MFIEHWADQKNDKIFIRKNLPLFISFKCLVLAEVIWEQKDRLGIQEMIWLLISIVVIGYIISDRQNIVMESKRLWERIK